MHLVPFLPCHLKGLKLNEFQEFSAPFLDDENYVTMLLEGVAYTAIDGDIVLGCGGMMQITQNRWQAWALVSTATRGKMLKATALVRKFLNEHPVVRLETVVRHDFENGHRWAKALGFVNETPNGMKKYYEDGCDYDLYARVI